MIQNTKCYNSKHIYNVNKHTSKKSKQYGIDKTPRKCHDKRQKKNNDTNRTASFYNTGNIISIKNKFDR